MKRLLKKIIPKNLVSFYHYLLPIIANFFYGKPSEKLIVIGVTGTSGKSSVIEMIIKVLEEGGHVVGAATTIKFKIANNEFANDKKMTMVGRFQLQKFLSQMVQAGCTYAIVETTSEGIRQFRHIGIHYDVCVFTNLYPEHIDSHGSFENYKNEKLKLFKQLSYSQNKIINGKKIPRIVIANLDDPYAPEFLAFEADKKYGYTVQKKYDITGVEEILGSVISDRGRMGFQTKDASIYLNLLGNHNVFNALAAYSVGVSQNISILTIQSALEKIYSIPGRIEFVEVEKPFKVIIDYAFEPRAMEKLYEVVGQIQHGRIIHVLGTTGGGRDKSRGKILGRFVGTKADIVIATNEDPYDDDPSELMNRVYSGAQEAGKIDEQNLFAILDRRKAIQKAFRLAAKDDYILITGKGSETLMVGKNNKKISWNDKEVVLGVSKELTPAQLEPQIGVSQVVS